MAIIKYNDKEVIEKYLSMSGGYVLDFTDKKFSEFVLDATQINIDNEKYKREGTSKAKRLRSFIKLEPNSTVATLLSAFDAYIFNSPFYSRNNSTPSPELRNLFLKIIENLKSNQKNVTVTNNNQQVIKNKIFISHAYLDKNYIQPFVNKILKTGLEIPSNRIFCSSLPGNDIKAGESIPQKLKEEFNNSSLVLLFISQNYKNSEACLGEQGAACLNGNHTPVIPILLQNVDIKDLGIFNSDKLALKISSFEDIIKLAEDYKSILNPNFNLNKLHSAIESFFKDIATIDNSKNSSNNYTQKLSTASIDITSRTNDNESIKCFENTLYPFHEALIKYIPDKGAGFHQIINTNIQNKIIKELNSLDNVESLELLFADGNQSVRKIIQESNGNWLMDESRWEIRVSKMFVLYNGQVDYDLVLIKNCLTEPYHINSDTGGTSHIVGLLNNGLIISRNEYLDNYAIFNGESINLTDYDPQRLERSYEPKWIFLVSQYHKAGYNPNETIEFCQKLDSGEIEVNERNIMNFLRSLKNHHTVIRNR